MEIRRADRNDAAAISALNRTVQALHAAAYPHLFKQPSPETFPTSQVAALIDQPDNVFYLAVVDGVPAGYVYARIVHRPEHSLTYALDRIYIDQISVDRAYQRLGIGSALIAAVKDLARAEGISQLALDTWAFNEGARTFFERQGFAVYNTRLWMDLGHL